MNRPYLVNFSAIISDEQLSIRASITDSITPLSSKEKSVLSTPIQSVGLFSKERYRIRILLFNQSSELLYKKDYDSDNYGRFEIKRQSQYNNEIVAKISVYEISKPVSYTHLTLPATPYV